MEKIIDLTVTSENFELLRALAINNNTTVNNILGISLRKWYENNKSEIDQVDSKLQKVSVRVDEETAKAYEIFINSVFNELIANGNFSGN